MTKFIQNLHPVEMALQTIRRRSMVETEQSMIACLLAQEGRGVAIVDPFSASEFVGRGLVVRRFEPEIAVGTALIRSSERPLSLIAQEFHDAFLTSTHNFLQKASYLKP